MQNEVGTGEQRRQQRLRALVGRLGIRILEPQSDPPVRNGIPSRRANCPAAKDTSVGSGVPKVARPIAWTWNLAKTPNSTGAPARISWVVAAPDNTSANTWASVPAAVTGTHGARQYEGCHDGRLLVCGHRLERAQHGWRPTPWASWR